MANIMLNFNLSQIHSSLKIFKLLVIGVSFVNVLDQMYNKYDILLEVSFTPTSNPEKRTPRGKE